MKEDAVTEETPKKRRTRAAATAPEGTEAKAPAAPRAPARRKKAETDATAADPAQAAEPVAKKTSKTATASKAAKATAKKTAEPAAEAAEPVEKKAAAPRKRKAAASKTAKAAENSAESVEPQQAPSAPAPSAEPAPPPPAPAAQAPEQAAAPSTGTPEGAPSSRRDRHRHRNERRGQAGQQAQSAGEATADASAPAADGAQPAAGAPQPTGNRRRRKRRRGGGGGQQLNPQLEAQMQPVSGLLEIDDRGNGRLRSDARAFQAQDNDPEVPKQLIERLRLRPGVFLNASALTRNNKLQVQRVDQVDGGTLEEAQNRISFMNLTSVDPERRIKLETTAGELLTRAIDIIAPIGFGQRGLIVAPPKTGKTIILQKIAKAVLTNYPSAKLMVLLIDERPEEVTDFKRSIGAEVFASSSDRPAHEHLRIAELVLERARRDVEKGEDVVVLLDSITRLARAYNKEVESSGRTMSGGVDSRALERPKRLFGAARNTEEAGSLTILGTALVDTGSRMDEVIFEEFKGTGNMEIVLDRQLAERRLFPAINVNGSGTRKEEKLFSPAENEKMRKLRAYLAALRPVEAMEKLLGRLRDFESNEEFFDAL